MSRTTYTKEQLTAYFERVSVPAGKRIYDVSGLDDSEQLKYLTLLFRHELCKVPWENLAQHYSWHHQIHVSPRHLYRKIVSNEYSPSPSAGRGGYCMEANSFFFTVLLSLGFKVYQVGSRIYNPPTQTFGGFTHTVNLVIIGGKKYMVDGGFGANACPHPIRLEADVVNTQVAPTQCRVTSRALSQNLDKEQRSWVYEFRFDENSDWIPAYCFTEYEFFPEDITVMNMHPAYHKQTFFNYVVCCVRFTTAAESLDGPGSPGEKELEAEIDGGIILFKNTLKWRRHGQKVLEIEFKDDAERVAALEKYFGITFDQEDLDGILGSAAEVNQPGVPGL